MGVAAVTTALVGLKKGFTASIDAAQRQQDAVNALGGAQGLAEDRFRPFSGSFGDECVRGEEHGAQSLDRAHACGSARLDDPEHGFSPEAVFGKE